MKTYTPEERKFIRGAIALVIYLRYSGMDVEDSFAAADEFLKEIEK